jgi:Zn-dependent membrane protease YugP
MLDTNEVYLPLFVFVEDVMNIYFDAHDGAIDMSLLAILLFVGTMALSLWATMRVRQVYGKFSQFPASSGASGAETAATILRQEGIYGVEIVEHDEMLGDHYDPIHKRLVLSRDTFHGTSTAALGVAAHECGHAIQHQQAYAPLQWRMASVGLTTFASQIVLWLPLLGIFTGFLNTGVALILVATAWGILMLFNLITLPVEFDASARARLVLKQTGLIQMIEEETAVAKVLRAAAWTYVAAFITSLVYFLLHVLPLLGGRRE